MEIIKKNKNYNNVVDEIENVLLQGEQIHCPVKHHFTSGLYAREIFMPAGTTITSKIHKTEHPYVISKGMVSVIKEDNGIEILEAPFFGVTKPGTRRVLYVHEDCIWTTFHRTRIKPASANQKDIEEAVDKIEKIIIKTRINKLAIIKIKEDLLCRG